MQEREAWELAYGIQFMTPLFAGTAASTEVQGPGGTAPACRAWPQDLD